MSGNKTISGFANTSERGGMFVPVEQPVIARMVSERAKGCFRSAENGAICLDQVQGSFEDGVRQLRKSSRSALILKREIIHLLTGNLLPAPDPEATKGAFSVVNDQWFSRWQGQVEGEFHNAVIARFAIGRQHAQADLGGSGKAFARREKTP